MPFGNVRREAAVKAMRPIGFAPSGSVVQMDQIARTNAVEGEVIYEVNLDIDAGIESDYRDWLRGHIDEILALPGFVSAQLFDVVDPAPAPGRIALCTQYHVRDTASLQKYFKRHAARLRGDGMARFDGKFCATRRVLRLI